MYYSAEEISGPKILFSRRNEALLLISMDWSWQIQIEAMPHLLFPAADLHPCWGQSHCQGHQCSRFRWPSQRCPDHLSDPSYLWSQTCAVCHPGCPVWWLKETFSIMLDIDKWAQSFMFIKLLQQKNIYSCLQFNFLVTFRNTHTYLVHAPKAGGPPPRYSLMVQPPAQKQTLLPGPAMTQNLNDWMDLREKINRQKHILGIKVSQLFSQL